MPITKHAVEQEWDRIITMVQNNGFPVHLMHNLRNKPRAKKDCTTLTQTKENNNRKWSTFTYHSPSIYKVTNLFIRTNLKIAFRPTNTTYQQLTQKPRDHNPSGIYQLKCSTCNNAYIGQSGRSVTVWHREHTRYIRNSSPTSAYAAHILDNRHEFGPADQTLKLLKPCIKGTKMNCWEAFFMHIYHKHIILISEQQVTYTNPLFDLAYIPRGPQHHL